MSENSVLDAEGQPVSVALFTKAFNQAGSSVALITGTRELIDAALVLHSGSSLTPKPAAGTNVTEAADRADFIKFTEAEHHVSYRPTIGSPAGELLLFSPDNKQVLRIINIGK